MIRSDSDTRRVRMTKRMMKDALMELMEHRPLSSVSVTELCRQADVNRSTFYSYYDDLSGLLREIENDLIEQMPRAAEETSDYKLDRQMLDDFTAFFSYVRTHSGDFDILLRNGNTDFSERILSAAMKHFPRQDTGEEASLKNRWGYIYAMNGVIGLLRDWIRSGFPVDDRRFAESVLRMSISAYDALSGSSLH